MADTTPLTSGQITEIRRHLAALPHDEYVAVDAGETWCVEALADDGRPDYRLADNLTRWEAEAMAALPEHVRQLMATVDALMAAIARVRDLQAPPIDPDPDVFGRGEGFGYRSALTAVRRALDGES